MDLSQLEKCDFFKGLSEEDIASLLFSSPGALRQYKVGDYVARQGEVCDKIAILTKGSVSSYMVNDYGKELIMTDLHSPCMIGYTYLFATNNVFNVNVIAKTSCDIYFVERERLVALMHEKPLFMQAYLRGMADVSLKVFKRVYELNLHKLKQRILSYMEQHKELPKQAELAKQLGVTRTSVARALAELRRNDIIHK